MASDRFRKSSEFAVVMRVVEFCLSMIVLTSGEFAK